MFSSFLCFSGNEKSLPEISYIEGKKIQALTGCETNNMLRMFVHSVGLQRSRWNLFVPSSSFPHDEKPLLGNTVAMTKSFRDAEMEASEKYYHLFLTGVSSYLWLPNCLLTYSSLTSSKLDGLPSSRLQLAVFSRKVIVTSIALLTSLSPSAPIKQKTVNNWLFTSQSFSSGKNDVKEETSASPTT